MNSFSATLQDFRKDLHRYPELGFQEHRTKAKIAERLRAKGLEVYEGVGVVGVLKSGNGNRTIGLRADMDALPIQETSTHSYVSKNKGVMHACGHDGHTSMLLGAAELLANRGDFDGTVVFIFQPNEEHGLGAQAMLADGFMDKHPVQEVYAIHNMPGLPIGHLATRSGQMCASESLFEITVSGQGGHASMPHVGVDAITVGAELVMALQTIVSRKLPPDAGAVVSVTEFTTDGQRNVLPGQAVLKGDVRARNPEDRKKINSFMRQIVNGIASTHAIDCNLTFNTEFVEVINAQEPTDNVRAVARKLGLDGNLDCNPMSFSEDFAHFSSTVPGCFLLLGNGDKGSHAQPLHSSDYDFNDKLLEVGATFWAELVKHCLPVTPD